MSDLKLIDKQYYEVVEQFICGNRYKVLASSEEEARELYHKGKAERVGDYDFVDDEQQIAFVNKWED